MSIELKPSGVDPKVGVYVGCDFATVESLERWIKALTVAKNWLKSAKAKKK